MCAMPLRLHALFLSLFSLSLTLSLSHSHSHSHSHTVTLLLTLSLSLFTTTLRATCSHATTHLHTTNIKSGATKLALFSALWHNALPTLSTSTVSHPDGRLARLPTSLSFTFRSLAFALSGSAVPPLAHVRHVVFFHLVHDSITDFRDLLALLFSTSSLDSFHFSGSVHCCSSSRCSPSHFSSSLQDRSFALPYFFPAVQAIPRYLATRLFALFVHSSWSFLSLSCPSVS